MSLLLSTLNSAASLRCGMLLDAHEVRVEACDIRGIFNVAVPADPSNRWQTTSGAVGKSPEEARIAAIAEGLERYTAAICPIDTRKRAELAPDMLLSEEHFALFSATQQHATDFPWRLHARPDDYFAEVFRLRDNRSFWVPQEFVGLGPRRGIARLPSTSSGLAAHRASTPLLALLRATQEALERDALAVTWLNGLAGREITVPQTYLQHVDALGGSLHAFDLTQAWNPHPVIALLGGISRRGTPRYGIGIACRQNYADAFDKAWLEWAQALTFAGYLSAQQGSAALQPADIRSFHEHAVFYTLRPDLWPHIPLLATRTPFTPPATTQFTSPLAPTTPAEELESLMRHLQQAGIDVYYRPLTTCDVAAAGLCVMRVLIPSLSLLHADERAPFLGGRTADSAWRYGDLARVSPFPNPLPHPLG